MPASQMRAVGITDGQGPISALHITQVPMPEPGPGQALVRIKAFGLNRMDLLQREGKYPVPEGVSRILGVEFSGVVVKVVDGDDDDGSGDDDGEEGKVNEETFKDGEEVFGLAYGGAYAEYIAVSTKMLIHKPPSLSFELCAGIPETWITATQALYLVGGWSPEKSILWHAGASSVSIAGIQLCHAEREDAAAKNSKKTDNTKSAAQKSKIFVTASSSEKIEFCKTLGADEGFNYKEGSGDWDAGILSATDNAGVDLIIDFVGASYFARNLNAIGRDGRIVNLGFLGGSRIPAETDIGAFVRKRVRFEGSALRSRSPGYQGKLRGMLEEHALPRIVSGQFKVPVEKVFDWKDIQKAHTLMESNQTKGKIICTIDWEGK